MTETCGIVLAGGASRRMGTDKAVVMFQGRTLLEYAISALQAVTPNVLVVGRTSVPVLDIRCVPDEMPCTGPMGGILTALHATRAPMLLVLACDMPDVTPEVLRMLLQRAPGYEAVVPVARGRSHPLLAAYDRSIEPEVRRRVQTREYRMTDLLAALRVRWVSEAELVVVDSELTSFTNVNSPADLRRIR